MADYYTQYSAEIDKLTDDEIDWLEVRLKDIEEARANDDGLGEDDHDLGQVELGDRTLWFCARESGDPQAGAEHQAGRGGPDPAPRGAEGGERPAALGGAERVPHPRRQPRGPGLRRHPPEGDFGRAAPRDGLGQPQRLRLVAGAPIGEDPDFQGFGFHFLRGLAILLR